MLDHGFRRRWRNAELEGRGLGADRNMDQREEMERFHQEGGGNGPQRAQSQRAARSEGSENLILRMRECWERPEPGT